MFTAIATTEYPHSNVSIKPVLRSVCTAAITLAFISSSCTSAFPANHFGAEETALFSTSSARESEYYNGNISFCWDGVSIMSAERTDSLFRILEIERLEDNWNGNGAASFSGRILSAAKNLVMTLSVQPAIFPTARDSIQFEYEKESGDYLEIELFENGRIKVFSYRDNVASTIDNIVFSEVNKVVNEFYGREV